MKKNLTSRFTVQYTDRRAEQVKLCPFVLFPQSYEKTIVISNIVILHAVDNGADCGVCGGYFG